MLEVGRGRRQRRAVQQEFSCTRFRPVLSCLSPRSQWCTLVFFIRSHLDGVDVDGVGDIAPHSFMNVNLSRLDDRDLMVALHLDSFHENLRYLHGDLHLFYRQGLTDKMHTAGLRNKTVFVSRLK